MTKVIGVKFKENGKSYYFNPKDFDIKENDNVIVETVRGLEFGNVVFAKRILIFSRLASIIFPSVFTNFPIKIP